MARKAIPFVFIAVLLVLAGCSTPTPDSDAIAKAVQATLSAAAPMPTEIAVPPTALPTPGSGITTAPAATQSPLPNVTYTDTPAPTPTNTPRPTNTPVPTNTFTPVPEPVVLSGRGQAATNEFVLPSPVSVARFTHNGQRNFIVTVYQEGKHDLLVNTIGAYQGERPLWGQAPVMLDIQADGAWTVEVRPVESAASAAFSGTGDAISGMFAPPQTGPWEISHSGQRNFIVYLHCTGESDLVQNEIGPVSGSRVVSFPEGPCLWEVQADGTWSLTPRSTNTSIPTTEPSPPTTAASGVPFAAASKVVNMRSGPGTNYPVVGAARVGSQYEITGRNQDGSWLEVCCVNTKPAWVARSIVTVVGDAGAVALAESIPPTPAPNPSPISQVPDGWVQYADTKGEFVIWLPPGWRAERGTGQNENATDIWIDAENGGLDSQGLSFGVEGDAIDQAKITTMESELFGNTVHTTGIFLPYDNQHSIWGIIFRSKEAPDPSLVTTFVQVLETLNLR